MFLEGDEAATFDEWRDAVEAAMRAAFAALGRVDAAVHDARRMGRVPSEEEVRARIAFLTRQTFVFGLMRWAALVSRPAHLAVGRMAETLCDVEPIDFRVFTDPDEAEAWARGGSE